MLRAVGGFHEHLATNRGPNARGQVLDRRIGTHESSAQPALNAPRDHRQSSHHPAGITQHEVPTTPTATASGTRGRLVTTSIKPIEIVATTR